MVRVISIHHFTNQVIQTVEQPNAVVIAPPNRLLLALPSHCIEVRDLNFNCDVLFSFPTVNEVLQLLHCLNGDYIVTLERFQKQDKSMRFVRIYVNWDNVATMQQSKMTSNGLSLSASECGMVQPMRARIAGRVTPTTNQSEVVSLEMIEIPVNDSPTSIACCQISGNILVQCSSVLSIYAFQIKSHDISKLKFIDFEGLPFSIELSFIPNEVDICENYIVCMNSDSFHMFRIKTNSMRDVSLGNHNVDDCDFSFSYSQDDSPIDYEKLLKEEALNLRKDKITVHLPMIVKENSAVHRQCPFTICDKDMTASVKTTFSMENKISLEIENLVQLKLTPLLIESGQKQVKEEFKSFVLKPLYVDQSINKTGHYTEQNKYLKSEYRQCLNSVACIFTTQQEGYLYQFCDSETTTNIDKCIAVYPFTAPVYKLVLEDYFLHALTETGLESYTLRIGHQLCRSLDIIDDVNVACPPVSDSVCLVGLRPFLGVEQMITSENHLVLFANADGSPTHSVSSNGSSYSGTWTLYSLQLPSPTVIFNDISIVANSHKFTSVQTYRHLMSEGHMILRMSLLLKKWTSVKNNVVNVVPEKKNNEECIAAYRTSCALLGDHFILSPKEKEYPLAIPYYKMGGVAPSEVLRRVKEIQEQSNNNNTKGLIHYLRTILLDIKFGTDADKFFSSGSRQNFVETILDLFKKHNYSELPYLILRSRILREYSTEKLINVLECSGDQNDQEKKGEHQLSLALLYIQMCNMIKAEQIISSIEKDQLYSILFDNWELLLELTIGSGGKVKASTTFSELTVLLMSVHPDILAELFSDLMADNKPLTLHKVLKIFLDYLPSSIGTDTSTASSVLQRTLEMYFKRYFAKQENLDLPLVYDRATHEAMKLLVRSYLSQLQLCQMKEKVEESPLSKERKNSEEDSTSIKNQSMFESKSKNDLNENYLFSNLRFEYLNKMPPFQVEINSKIYETCVENYIAKGSYVPDEEADLILKKLQALFCSQVVPKQVLIEANTFLSLNEDLRGAQSLQSLIMHINDAVLFLIDVCPQCLLQYGKDRFTKNDEWKFLIATIQRRILKLSQNIELKRVCFFHKKLLKDVLTYVATTMNLDQLLQVFPQKLTKTDSDCSSQEMYKQEIYNKGHKKEIPCKEMHKKEMTNGEIHKTEICIQKTTDEDPSKNNEELEDYKGDILDEIQNYEPYVTMCKETMHANQIKKLITATGHQLLCTLNL